MPTIPGSDPPAEPFDALPAWIAASPKITATEMGLLLVLVHHRNSRTGLCCPSHQTVATEAGMSRDTVKRVLASLREKGLVGWIRKDGQTNRYLLNLHQGVAESAPPPGASCTTEPDEGNQMKGTSPGDASLPGMPEPNPPAKREPNAGDLVRSWCYGWKEQRGSSPDPAVVKRVAGSCAQIARSRTDLDSWRLAWHAAKDAGRRGQYDVVAFMADYHPPARESAETALLRETYDPANWSTMGELE